MNDVPLIESRPLWQRLARYFLVVAGVVLLLYSVAGVGVPLVVSHLVFPRLSETLGRQVDAQSVRFNPFTLVLSAKALRIAAVDTPADLMTVEAVTADLSVTSLRHLAPVIDALRIERPVVHLQRTATDRFNFSDILERLRSRPADPEADASPARFALHNLEVSGGEIRLDDQVLKQQHQVTELAVRVPSISSLDAANATAVQPVLSARVNDSPLNITGTTLPFSPSRETTLDVRAKDVAIATYLRLSPVPLGFSVPKGSLDASLQVRFAQEDGVNRLTVSGDTVLEELQVDARQGARLAQAKRISVGLDRIEPLAGRYAIGELEVQGLNLDLVRQPDGDFPITRAFGVQPSQRSSPPATPSGRAGARAEPGQAVQWSIRKTAVRGARVTYRDAAVAPPVRLDHTDIQVDLAEIGNRQAKPADAKLSLKQNGSNQLTWAGTFDLARSRAEGRLDASASAVAPYLPYFASLVNGALETGALKVSGRLQAGWAEAFTLEVADAQASVEKATLFLPKDSGPAIAIGRLAVSGVAFSLAGRRVAIGEVALAGARVQVERDSAGLLNLQRLAGVPAAVKAGGEAGATSPSPKQEAEPERDGAPPWFLRVDRLSLAGNDVIWRDLGGPSPVEVPVSDLSGRIEGLGTDLSVPSKVDLRAKVGGAGTVAAQGEVVVAPWSMQLVLQVQKLGLAAFDPYLERLLTLSLVDGSLSAGGELRFGAERAGYRGSIAIDGLRSQERASSTQTIRWGKLALEGVDVEVGTAAVGPGDRIVIGGATLSEFFARVLLDEQGRFNLQDVLKTAGADSAATAGSVGSVEPKPNPESAPPGSDGGSATAGAGPAIRLGTVKLERGRASFTDRFVEPNYSVNLTDLNGSLSPMASDAPGPSTVALTGRVDGNAPIEITGQVNPFGASLSADLRAQAKGIDLPTLTPYAVKYAGYTIERGTLSLDVRYRIENRRLEAQNRVVLNQLTLGEKVDSPDAVSLPIQFALGLLKNRNGEIDVSLPISGSLNDPQFSIGGIIGSAIVNLLTRMITSPFSMLASAFGSRSAELSFVEFRSGTADLTAEAVDRLRVIAKALAERPALKLEIAGRVDPKAESDAIRKQRLDARLRALKRRQASGADAGRDAREALRADSPPPARSDQPSQEPDSADGPEQQAQVRQEEAAVAAGVTVSADEYPVLLRKLYDDTALPDKARDPVGVAQTLEVAEMEKRLLAAIAVDPQTVRRLATRRSQAVRQWLATQGSIEAERMFMLAPRTRPDMKGPDQAKPQCLANCAEFSLR